jgi:hypothetical protein
MAKIYGALEVAQVEWFTQSPDTRPAAASNIYRVIYASDVKQVQVSDGTTWRPSNITTYTAATLPAAGATNQYQIAFITDTLQVKVSNGTVWTTIGARLDTFTSGTIPAAASYTNQMIWVSDLQQVQVSNGTSWVLVGSKAGTKNYFSQNNANADFETNSTTPWSACTLTFSGNAPSGAPTLSATQMTLSVSSSDPLAGAYSMLLTKAAANAQYQGFISGTLTIDREDTAKVLYGSFAYEVVSGTVDFSGTSTQTYEIWIYNTVSGAWTQPAGFRGMNQSSGPGKVVFSFQTDGSTANNAYKIAVITQQTGTGAIVVKFDDFQIGPSALVTGAVITDWESYTPTTQGLGTIASVAMYWRRVGANVEIMGNLTTGTVTASEAQIGLPGGVTSNSNISTIQMAGTVLLGATTSAYRNLLIETSKTYMTIGLTTTGGQLVKQNGTTFANSSVLSFQASVPVQGWSSNVQMSNDTDTRVVAFQATGTVPAVAANNPLVYPTVTFDTHGAYNASTGKYTIPVSGVYRIKSTTTANPSLYTNVSVYKNNVQLLPQQGSADGNGHVDGTFLFQFVAGDVIDVRLSGTITAPSTVKNIFTVERLSGPSVIAASETVAAKYWATANGTTNTTTPVNFDSKVYDTHNAVTTGASWKFTAPISGKYSLKVYLANNGAVTSGTTDVYKSGVKLESFGYISGTIGAASSSVTIELNSGEYVDIRQQATYAWLGSVSRSGGGCFIEIERVGN